MRINAITAYTGVASQPQNKNVSFGLIENEENTRRVLPKNSGYRLKFDNQFEYLKKHDAITVTSKDNKAWARINKGFEKMYALLNYKNVDKPNHLVDLEEQDQFDSFYYGLQFCDDKRNGAKPLDLGTSSGSKESAYDQAYYDGKIQL